MERKVLKWLIEWKNSTNRKPLILQGARQVGKTYSALTFGKEYYDSVVYFNFENNKELYEAPIRVKFNSKFSEYDTLEEWGQVQDYKYKFESYRNESTNYKFNPFPILPPVQNQEYMKAVNEKKKKRDSAIEMALITMLDKYISSEVYTLFGKNTPYCIKRAEVMDAKAVNTYGPCSEEYEIVVGLKVGKRPPFYNNMIITFLINENGVKIKNVKNPRYK